jgi:phosphatidylserine decarboxylase
MFNSITSNLIWTESLWLALGLLALTVAGWFFFKPVFYVGLIIFIFCFYFFRNPERICPEALIDSNVIVCPADGKVVDISYDPDGGFKGYHYKISIFLSPLNVHVNWTPIAGIIEKIEYVPGKFMMAFLPKSSELNEHNDVLIRAQDGKQILVRQIAGTVARRIVCWLQQGQEVHAGQKYGMIKFSSRIDLFLPENVKLELSINQKVTGGKTVIGRFL